MKALIQKDTHTPVFTGALFTTAQTQKQPRHPSREEWIKRHGTHVSVQFSCSVVSNSLRPNGLQHARPPCPSPTPRVYPNSSPLSQWRHPTISSSVVPFSSCPQSFPASGSFPVCQLFPSGGQRVGASASTPVLPMNIQGWFPLGLTGLISAINSSVLSFMVQLTLTHNYWKNHSFGYMDLCQQSNVFPF